MSAYRIEAELIGASDFPPLNETVEDILSSQNHFFGFIKNESLIGVIEIEEAESHSIISRLVVCPSVFRQGIASQLLRSCLNSDTDYQVTTAENNLPAISLYKRFGFLESETYSTPDLSVKLITLNRSVKLSVNESYEAGIQ
ncbi:MAG: GNAT family N-acetyltransferase [Endozoicomonas sp.]|uniref:GNAT family N-acetyltransferase n=1 Tax=Endozoicomonas sp. TaxID=1892382 RepID=UPI003D9B2B6F